MFCKFRMRQEVCTQPRAGPANTGLHGTQRRIHDVGGLRVVEPVQVDEDDGRALILGEGIESGLDQRRKLPLLGQERQPGPGVGDIQGCARFVFAGSRPVERDRAVLSTAPPEFVLTLIGGDAEQPRTYVSTLETPNRPEGGKERLLSSVLGGFA